ncbi:MAG TPA: hypothetical protein VF491_03910 [Vicinamibacterales bacterium]
MDVKRQRPPSGFSNRLFSLVGIVGLFALVMAGATVWLLVTDPVTVAESMDSGEVTPLVQSLAGSIYDAIVKLLRYL